MHLLVMKSLHRQSWRKKKKKKSPHSTGVGKAETLVRKDFHVNNKPPIQSISGERQIILCSLTVILRSYPWHGKNNKDLCLPAVPLHCIQDQALFPFSLKAKQNLDITCMQNIPLFFFFFLVHVFWAMYSFKRKASLLPCHTSTSPTLQHAESCIYVHSFHF